MNSSSAFIVRRAVRVVFDARRAPETARAARAWLALAAAFARRHNDDALASRLGAMETHIL